MRDEQNYIVKERRGTKMNIMRLGFGRGDLIAVMLPLILAAAVFLAFLPGAKSGVAIAEIYQDGNLLRRVSLNTDQEFSVSSDYQNTVTVRDGKIAITHSDCPGGDCMHTGWISTSGRSIVCLPNRLEIRIVSQTGDVDFVVG